MFVRLVMGQISKEKIDNAIEFYRKSIVPAAKSQKGFVSANLLINRKNGKGASITYWNSENDTVENEKSGYLVEQVAKFSLLFSTPLVVEDYEVVV